MLLGCNIEKTFCNEKAIVRAVVCTLKYTASPLKIETPKSK
jgi:hypothetical protein